MLASASALTTSDDTNGHDGPTVNAEYSRDGIDSETTPAPAYPPATLVGFQTKPARGPPSHPKIELHDYCQRTPSSLHRPKAPPYDTIAGLLHE